MRKRVTLLMTHHALFSSLLLWSGNYPKKAVSLTRISKFSSKQRCKEVFEIIKILTCLPIYFFVMHKKISIKYIDKTILTNNLIQLIIILVVFYNNYICPNLKFEII